MTDLALLAALGAASVMGFANQRGGTCTVAAIEEIASSGRFTRLAALMEAALWVGAGLLLLKALGALPPLPPGYGIGLLTIGGSVLFGLGAFVNRACLFGTVARLGSGEWAFLATPVGLYVGSLATSNVKVASKLTHPSFLLAASAAAGVVAFALVAARVASHCLIIRQQKRPILAHIWSPHVATTIIGITFLVTFVTAGQWDYADLLANLARGETAGWARKLSLAAALIGGAMFGGWTAGKIRSVRPELSDVLKRLAGGGLMGAGAALIPGGNTGLILLGMPLLWPYAWLAVATICVTIYLAIRYAPMLSADGPS